MGDTSKYKVSATIAGIYAPVINRSRMLHEQTPKSEFPRLREQGAINLDLWVDGSVYRHHPNTNKRPSFRSVSELLEFVAQGKRGLWGYIESIGSANTTLQFHLDEARREISRLQEQVRILMSDAEEANNLLQLTRGEVAVRERLQQENRETLSANESLKTENNSLKQELSCMWSCLQTESLRSAQDQVQLEINFKSEIESQRKSHEEKLKLIKCELRRTTATLKRREKRLENLVKTPYGYRSTVRERKDLSSLAPIGGHAKRIARIARSLIAPNTSKKIQLGNEQTGSHQRSHKQKYQQCASLQNSVQ